MTTLSANEIASTILFWFGAIPDGLFGKVSSDGTTLIKDPAVVDWLDTAIAVCLAESGGDTNAKNANSTASGLWQIMVSVHEDTIGEGIRWVETKSKDDKLDVFDPRVNTFAAGSIYFDAGRKWTPWEAYNTGAYKKYVGKGDAAFDWLNTPEHRKQFAQALLKMHMDGIDGMTLPDVGGFIEGVKDTANAIPNSVDNVLKFLRSGAMTVGLFLLGLIALILGVVFIIMASPTAKTAVKTAADVIPAGKIIKKVT